MRFLVGLFMVVAGLGAVETAWWVKALIVVFGLMVMCAPEDNPKAQS